MVDWGHGKMRIPGIYIRDIFHIGNEQMINPFGFYFISTLAPLAFCDAPCSGNETGNRHRPMGAVINR